MNVPATTSTTSEASEPAARPLRLMASADGDERPRRDGTRRLLDRVVEAMRAAHHATVPF